MCRRCDLFCVVHGDNSVRVVFYSCKQMWGKEQNKSGVIKSAEWWECGGAVDMNHLCRGQMTDTSSPCYLIQYVGLPSLIPSTWTFFARSSLSLFLSSSRVVSAAQCAFTYTRCCSRSSSCMTPANAIGRGTFWIKAPGKGVCVCVGGFCPFSTPALLNDSGRSGGEKRWHTGRVRETGESGGTGS